MQYSEGKYHMGEVKLRNAEKKDAPAIADVWVRSIRNLCAPYYTDAQIASWTGSKTPEKILELIMESPFFMVAEMDGRVVGFASCSDFREIQAALYVAPESTGKGTGRQLLTAYEEAAREHGLKTLHIHATVNGAGFYEKCGYERIGENALADGRRIVHVKKKLQE